MASKGEFRDAESLAREQAVGALSKPPKKKDAASKQCYKALANMHEAFGRLVDSVHQMGSCANASRDLQGQIDELNARNVSGAIERISADLKQVLEANARLEAEAS